jgi:hypothetical protein
MAGDWIPMRVDLASDPAVIAIGARLNEHPYMIVGRLHKIWSWANMQLRDCYAPGVTKTFIDAHVGKSGFANAMIKVGWLRSDKHGISFPNFDTWNSKSGKQRLLSQSRMQRHRYARSVTKASPEKRREESNTPPKPPKGGKVSKRQQRKDEEAAREELRRWYDGLPSKERRRLTEAATGSEHGCYDIGGVPLHHKMAQVRALCQGEQKGIQ